MDRTSSRPALPCPGPGEDSLIQTVPARCRRPAGCAPHHGESLCAALPYLCSRRNRRCPLTCQASARTALRCPERRCVAGRSRLTSHHSTADRRSDTTHGAAGQLVLCFPLLPLRGLNRRSLGPPTSQCLPGATGRTSGQNQAVGRARDAGGRTGTVVTGMACRDTCAQLGPRGPGWCRSMRCDAMA